MPQPQTSHIVLPAAGAADAMAPRARPLLTTRNVTIFCAIVVAFYALLLGAQVGRPKGWPIDDKARPIQTDYIALWAAGHLALEGRPAAVYDWDAHRHAMAEGLQRLPREFPFPYPPTFLTIIAPFAALPYIPSLLLWSSLTLAVFAVAAARIVGRWEGAVWMTAPIVTLANFNVGQNGFLTAALLGGSLLALPTRPILAGVLIGALSFKPHLGLLIPFALMAGGYWMAFRAAAASVAGFALLSMALFGVDAWRAFFSSLGHFGATVASDQFFIPYKLQSVYGLLHTMGLPRTPALTIQALLAVVLAAVVVLVWRSRTPFALKAALLASASVLTTPYVFLYDLTMLSVAQAFLIAHILPRGVTPANGIWLIAVNVATALFMGLMIPTGVVAGLMLTGLILCHARPDLDISSPWSGRAGLAAR